MIKKIVKYGDDILREKTKPVKFEEIEPLLPGLLEDMEDTCIAASGAGLAANQIGLAHRLAIILLPPEKKGGKHKRIVIINPEFLEKEGEVFEEEGCLSFPGLYAVAKRYKKVKVRALNEKGVPVDITAEGLLAKALQHEIGHLDGEMFIDYIDPKLKPQLKKALKTLAKQWK